MGENPGDGSREINQSKRTAFHPSFYTKFWKGAQEAVQGTIVAVKNPVVKEHYKKILKQTLLLMIITYSLAFVFYVLPLKFFYFIFGWDVNEEGNFELTVLMQVGYIVPHVYFIIVELFFNQIIEDLFFVTLGEQNEPLSKYLMGLPKLPRWKTIQTILKRNVMYLGIGIVLQFLSLLPVVGYFVFPAASTIFHMKIVGKEVSLVLGILFIFDSSDSTLFKNDFESDVDILQHFKTSIAPIYTAFIFCRGVQILKPSVFWYSSRI
uniref:Uncharacterized protein n=1 Tax=Paramoeba aestuarina TaxID=180227 RepID=A0A7S4PA51_9EUKA|mmetsp:Transcript_38774/g.61411  ORF Transcript_38774/g.61411 Transcript_38774/m.61411 type:complete len:265 (+) Transcript_38774:53-847(+)